MESANITVASTTAITTYTGVSLPGGAAINGDDFISQGTAEMEALRTDLLQRFPVLAVYHG